MPLIIGQMRILKLTAMISSLLFLLNCSKSEDVFYYLPENINKPFAIIYNQKDGVKLEKNENGNWVHYIPENGILVLADDDPVPDSFYCKMYYIDNSGDTIKKIRNYHFDVYDSIPIKKNETYEIDSFYRESENVKFQVIIITDDLSPKGQEEARDSATHLANYIFKKYGGM